MMPALAMLFLIMTMVSCGTSKSLSRYDSIESIAEQKAVEHNAHTVQPSVQPQFTELINLPRESAATTLLYILNADTGVMLRYSNGEKVEGIMIGRSKYELIRIRESGNFFQLNLYRDGELTRFNPVMIYSNDDQIKEISLRTENFIEKN